MLTVLLQGSEDDVRALLDTSPFLQLVTSATCHAYLIEDGAITELTDAENTHARESRAC